MRNKVEKYIARHNLLKEGDKVLVALSGGADSVALLHALTRLNYDCTAMHCNFHLRGEESNRDEQFCKSLCEELGVPLHTVHFDTAGHAKEKRVSIEMAARELRYTAFEEQRAATGSQAIAVAHHRDDSAETILLNLTRGTGIKGLCGISPKNGYIIRPLLCVGRREITDYLKHYKREYVTDSTNLTSDYTRNKIRLEVIPKLAEINPSIKESLAATGQKMREAELIYRRAVEESIERVKEGNTINIAALEKEIAPATILHEILSPLGFNSTQTDEISASLKENGSKQFQAERWSIIKERQRLIITPREEIIAIHEQLPSTGAVKTSQGTLTIENGTFDGTISKKRNTATLDAGKLQLPLTLRHAKKGDRFAPFGMRGTKLVSDYLTDCKRSLLEKREQLVVTDRNGEIVWLVNERPAAPFCVNKNTIEIIILHWCCTEE